MECHPDWPILELSLFTLILFSALYRCLHFYEKFCQEIISTVMTKSKYMAFLIPQMIEDNGDKKR